MLRLHYTRYLAGHPLHQTDRISMNKSGLPRCLHFLPLKSNDPNDIRFILTLLTATRGLTLEGLGDLTPITNESQFKVNECLEKYIQRFADRVCVKKRKLDVDRTFFKNYHLSTKAGPRGQAIATAFADLMVLPPELVDAVQTLGGDILKRRMDLLFKTEALEALQELSPVNLKDPLNGFRKLSLVQDKEGKTRIIAILDY